MTEVYSKAFASIESVDEKDYGPHGGFTAVLSTPSEDRDGDELFRDEWKSFTQERYPLDIDHGMSVADTIGSFVPYFDGQKMMMDARFANTAKAQEVRALVTPDESGIRHIQSVSVAFMVDKTKKSGTPRRELLNAGIVAIPANRDAVILASKAASALKDAFSDKTEGDVPEEVVKAVQEALGVTTDVSADGAETKEPEIPGKTGDILPEEVVEKAKTTKPGAIYIDVIPRINEDALKNVLEAVIKATATASGSGGDAALVQAIHDASSHLGAGCPVIEVTDPDSGASDGANKELDQEAFTKALDQTLTPEESPADEEPAPDVKSAAASDDAADTKAAKRARDLELLQMRAQSYLPKETI